MTIESEGKLATRPPNPEVLDSSFTELPKQLDALHTLMSVWCFGPDDVRHMVEITQVNGTAAEGRDENRTLLFWFMFTEQDGWVSLGFREDTETPVQDDQL